MLSNDNFLIFKHFFYINVHTHTHTHKYIFLNIKHVYTLITHVIVFFFSYVILVTHTALLRVASVGYSNKQSVYNIVTLISLLNIHVYVWKKNNSLVKYSRSHRFIRYVNYCRYISFTQQFYILYTGYENR